MSEKLKPCPFCGKTPAIYAVGKVFRDHPGFVKCECVDGVSLVTWNNRQVEDALLNELSKERDAWMEQCSEIQAIGGELETLKVICRALLDYRRHNTLNFQLEKLDDYLNGISKILEES